MPPFDRNAPYNDLPLLPPKAEIESKRVLKKCIGARAALAELKQAGELIPNQAVLINTIPLLEAKGSSEIENIVTTTDKLFEQAGKVSPGGDPATKETLRYRTALNEGFHTLSERPITTRTVIDICRKIRGVDVSIRNTPGTALGNPTTNEIIYTPPEGESIIREKLSNWETFIHSEDDVDPLIKLAVMHYQFEAIHPFSDGNGRTGRILNILYLIENKLLDIPVLYLSKHIISNKNEYYSLLKEVTEHGDWENWILFILDAVELTARWTTLKIKALRDLMEETTNFARDRLPKVYTRELIELTFVQPYCRISNVVDAGIAKRQTAASYLQDLEKIGILKPIKIGREKIFVNPKYIHLLTNEGNTFSAYL